MNRRDVRYEQKKGQLVGNKESSSSEVVVLFQ